MRGFCYVTALDIEKARMDCEKLSERGLKAQLGYQIRDMEKKTLEQRIRYRQLLIDVMRSAEKQEAERRAGTNATATTGK